MQDDDLMEKFEAYLVEDKLKRQSTGGQNQPSETRATQVEYCSEIKSGEGDSDA